MTRENKLALIIGFSLILVVAILITDHLSPAQTQRSADFRQVNHEASLLASGGGAIEGNLPSYGDGDHFITRIAPYPESNPADTRLASSSTAGMNQSGAADEQRERESILQRLDQGTPAIQTAPIVSRDDRLRPDRPESRVHTVSRGETLFAIAKRYYDDGSLADELALFNRNNMPDDLIIRAGGKLEIPDRSALMSNLLALNMIEDGGGDSLPRGNDRERGEDASGERLPRQRHISHEVEPNDTLSELSLRFLGTSKRWREIYELNRDVIDDPSILRRGITIRIPAN